MACTPIVRNLAQAESHKILPHGICSASLLLIIVDPCKQSGKLQRITGGDFGEEHTLLITGTQAQVPVACTLTDAALRLLAAILFAHVEIEIDTDNLGRLLPRSAQPTKVDIRLFASSMPHDGGNRRTQPQSR